MKPYAVHGDNSLEYGDWLVLTRGIGRDPDDRSGENFLRFPHTKIVRLNHGYHPYGTIPAPEYYEDFAARCAHYVEMSPGCSRWIVGNEPNLEIERPDGQPITPAMYAECYTLCRDAIKALPFHSGDQVLLAAVGPWNVQTPYPGNPSGDWVRYFEDVMYELPPGGCDGITLHTYVREQTPASVVSDARMASFPQYHWSFRAYMDWMAAILPRFQGLPVYITEFCVAGEAWRDADTGCVAMAYHEINAWNVLNPDLPISCLAMYRWEWDKWAFDDKPLVQQDFYNAVQMGYTVPAEDPEPPEETMLLNPSFEEGWHQQDAPQLVLPDGWSAEYWEGGTPWFRPEIKPNEEFTTDGRFSIRAFAPEHSRTRFGIWQSVDAEPDQWYKFSADVRLESKPSGRLAGYVGIQPWGAGIFKRQMVWGKETQVQIEWQRIEVIAQAFGGKIRVVMGATNDFATRNNTTWWDNARLEKWECDGGTDPEPPPDPGECNALTEEQVRQVVREELDKTVLGSGIA